MNNLIGTNLQRLNNNKGAIEKHNLALGYYEKLVENDKEYKIIHTLNNLGSAHFRLGELEIANTFYKRALLETKKKKDNRQRSIELLTLLHNLGAISFYYELLDIALVYFQEAESIAKKYSLTKKRINYLFAISHVFLTKKEYNKASEFNNKSKKLATQIGEREYIGQSLILQDTLNIQKVSTFNKILETEKYILENDINFQIPRIILNKIIYHYYQKNYKEVVLLYNNLEKIERDNGARVNSSYYMFISYLELGKIDKAIKFFKIFTSVRKIDQKIAMQLITDFKGMYENGFFMTQANHIKSIKEVANENFKKFEKHNKKFLELINVKNSEVIKQILKLLIKNLKYNEIAEELNFSERKIKNYIKVIQDELKYYSKKSLVHYLTYLKVNKKEIWNLI